MNNNRLRWTTVAAIGAVQSIVSIVNPSLLLVIGPILGYWLAMRIWYGRGSDRMRDSALLALYVTALALLATAIQSLVCRLPYPTLQVLESCHDYSTVRMFIANLFSVAFLPVLVWLAFRARQLIALVRNR